MNGIYIYTYIYWTNKQAMQTRINSRNLYEISCKSTPKLMNIRTTSRYSYIYYGINKNTNKTSKKKKHTHETQQTGHSRLLWARPSEPASKRIRKTNSLCVRRMRATNPNCRIVNNVCQRSGILFICIMRSILLFLRGSRTRVKKHNKEFENKNYMWIII